MRQSSEGIIRKTKKFLAKLRKAKEMKHHKNLLRNFFGDVNCKIWNLLKMEAVC